VTARKRTDGIVIHRAEVWSGSDYNFLVQKDGSVAELVPFTDVGQHALFYNRTTVAIAVFGDFAGAEPGRNATPTEAQLDACDGLVRSLVWWYGPLWLAGHSELGLAGTAFASKLLPGHTCPGERFPLARFKVLPGLTSR
jgi:hypothetical protein